MELRPRKRKPVYSLDQVLKGYTNPLGAIFCSGYSSTEYDKVDYNVFCDAYVSLEENTTYPFTITLQKTEQNHCGYCSDNDGSIETEVTEEFVYFKVPDGFTLKHCKSLYLEFSTVKCYCGGNNVTYEVLSIE